MSTAKCNDLCIRYSMCFIWWCFFLRQLMGRFVKRRPLSLRLLRRRSSARIWSMTQSASVLLSVDVSSLCRCAARVKRLWSIRLEFWSRDVRKLRCQQVSLVCKSHRKKIFSQFLLCHKIAELSDLKKKTFFSATTLVQVDCGPWPAAHYKLIMSFTRPNRISQTFDEGVNTLV